MNEEELQNKIAQLESMNDRLETELSRVDELMRLLGFAEGLTTLKETANDIFENTTDEPEAIEE